MVKNTMPAYLSQFCSLVGSLEPSLLVDCQTSLVANVFCFQRCSALFQHPLQAPLFLFYGIVKRYFLFSIFISFCSSNKFKLHPTIYTLVLVFLSGCSWLFEESQVSFKVEFTSPCMFSQRNLLDRSIAISLGPLCGCFIQVL